MEYSVEEIIKAALNDKKLPPHNQTSNIFVLRTGEGEYLSESDAESVRELIGLIEKKLNIKLRLTAGGKGCTRFVFEIIGDCPIAATEAIKAIANDEDLLSKVVEAKFRIIIDPSQKSRQNLGELIMGKDSAKNIISISDSTINGLQVGTKKSKQSVSTTAKTKTTNIQLLESALDELEEAVNSLDSDVIIDKADLVDDVASLKSEFKREAPRKSMITTLLNTLSSVAALVTFVNKIFSFITAPT